MDAHIVKGGSARDRDAVACRFGDILLRAAPRGGKNQQPFAVGLRARQSGDKPQGRLDGA